MIIHMSLFLKIDNKVLKNSYVFAFVSRALLGEAGLRDSNDVRRPSVRSYVRPSQHLHVCVCGG